MAQINTTTFADVDAAVARAAHMAMTAYAQGTFSVGGVLLDNEGCELHALHNNVIVDGMTHDPTAHGERQLIDWYFEQRQQGVPLPSPGDITVVTSLDPCCMCTGSLLAAGFKVVVGAFDDYAGINYNTQTDFPALAPALREQAQVTFSYPAVEGDNRRFYRPASGMAVSAFFSKNKTVAAASAALCRTLFDATVGTVKNAINTDLTPGQLLNPASLPEQDPLRVALRGAYARALTYTAPARGMPDHGLAPYLQAAMQQDVEQGGPGHAVALLDWFGNVLLCAAGNLVLSPIQTPFMRLTRAYAGLREQLARNPAVGEYKTRQYLPHPKYCTFVFSHGPDQSAQSLVDLGAFGSTMEGTIPAINPAPFQYVLPRMPVAELARYCQNLPPFYSTAVVINPHKVEDEGLIGAFVEC